MMPNFLKHQFIFLKKLTDIAEISEISFLSPRTEIFFIPVLKTLQLPTAIWLGMQCSGCSPQVSSADAYVASHL